MVQDANRGSRLSLLLLLLGLAVPVCFCCLLMVHEAAEPSVGASVGSVAKPRLRKEYWRFSPFFKETVFNLVLEIMLIMMNIIKILMVKNVNVLMNYIMVTYD